MEPMLDVSNLSFDYLSASSCLPVIDNISFQAFEGDFISIVGPSGCGKSTLLDIIAGLMPSSAGQVFFLGEPVIKPRKEIGYMLQRDQLFEWRSILRNTLLGPEIQHSSHKDKRKARKTASEMLTRYDLGGFLGAKPSELSGGMRQRAALIRTLIMEPTLLLLDEPFSALDYQTRLTVCNDICEIIRTNKKTAILVTHDLAEAVSTGNRVLVLGKRPSTIKMELVFDPDFTALSPLARRNHPLFNAGRFLIGILFFAIWEFCARFGIINDFIFSSPSRVIRTIQSFAANNTLWLHVSVTLKETALSFFMTMVISLFTALLFWRFRWIYKLFEPYLILLNSLPKSALAPLLIVWLGNKPRTIIVVAVSLAVFGAILTLYHAFESVDPEKIKLIQTLNGTKIHIITKVLLPSTVLVFINNMKVNIGLCLVGVIIGEFLAARAGLGYLIIYGSQTFKMDYVVTSIVILCTAAIVLYALLTWAESAYNRYYLKNASAN